MSGPAGTDVRGADWYGEDLSGQEHTRVAFSGVDLSETTDDGAVFTECTFRDCRAAFTGTRLREADLTGVRASGATLRHLDLSGAELSEADLGGADLRGSDLTAVDPRSVQLIGAEIDVAQAVVLVTALGLNVRPDAPD